jgi:hypothetical protein
MRYDRGINSKLLAPALSTGIDAIGNTVAATVDATCATARKLIRTAGAILTVTRRHVPAWIGGLLTICLLIPGPVDELLVLLVIAAMAAFKPAMRADFARTIPQAWTGAQA